MRANILSSCRWQQSMDFCALPVERLDELANAVMESDKNLFELIPPGEPVKPYFDLEMEPTDFRRLSANHPIMVGCLDAFLEMVKFYFKHKYGVELDDGDFGITEACKEGKLSYHVIVSRKAYFANLDDHNEFVKQMLSYYEKTKNEEHQKLFKRTQWIKLNINSEETKMNIVDTGVYDKWQNMRICNQSKFGQNIPLKCFRPAKDEFDLIADGLVRIYNDDFGERKLIEVPREDANGALAKLKRESAKTGKCQSSTSETYARSSFCGGRARRSLRRLGRIDGRIDRSGMQWGFMGEVSSIWECLMEKENLTYETLVAAPMPDNEKLLYLIPNQAKPGGHNGSQCREIALRIAFAARKAGIRRDVFEKWCALSPSFKSKNADTPNMLRAYDNARTGDSSHTYDERTLRNLALKSHPGYFAIETEQIARSAENRTYLALLAEHEKTPAFMKTWEFQTKMCEGVRSALPEEEAVAIFDKFCKTQGTANDPGRNQDLWTRCRQTQPNPTASMEALRKTVDEGLTQKEKAQLQAN